VTPDPRTTSRRRWRAAAAALALVAFLLAAWRIGGSGPDARADLPGAQALPGTTLHGAGRPETYQGLLTFRGDDTRTFYGEGPLPSNPKVLWVYPREGGMCAKSENLGETKVWCGTGWTGQPNVIQHADGKVEVRFGAYDDRYHFLDGRTGQQLHPDLITADLTKGSATSDPDGYPLYYGGSRDNNLRIIAVDRKQPTVLWELNAGNAPWPLWNDDWDGAPLVVGDYLMEGGENGWFYVVRLNRHFDDRGLVQVRPKVVMEVPGYDGQLFADLGDHDVNVSIENSVAYSKGVVYFGNSAGLVQGWDVSDVLKGGTSFSRVFRFWAGDETDASIAVDVRGDLYVARHRSANIPDRPQTRAHQIGSLMKLDPSRPDDPLVWSVQIGGFEPDGGILGTPALANGVVYVTDTTGGLVAVDQETGKILWRQDLPGPTWSSPVPIDGSLLVGDCAGVLHAYDVSNPRQLPTERWQVKLNGCIESTPAVWHGMIWVGTRGGKMYGIGDA
jgi:outer membrane protein assembly factor BamB